MSAMKKNKLLSAVATIGQRGTVVIPADIRRDAGLECGSTLMVIWNGETLRLQPVPTDPLERLEWGLNQAYEGKTGEEVEKSLKELHGEWQH
jgi:AbrB family looped-hinge helix DNA binding protein